MSWYESFKILTGCPSRSAQQEILIFPLHTESHFGTAAVFWRARGFEILRVSSFPKIIVLNLTNFPQNDRCSLISWLFSTKNNSYYTSSLYSVNFFQMGTYIIPKIHFEIVSLYWVEWLFCEAIIVWHWEERVLQEKRKIDSVKKSAAVFISRRRLDAYRFGLNRLLLRVFFY